LNESWKQIQNNFLLINKLFYKILNSRISNLRNSVKFIWIISLFYCFFKFPGYK